MGTGTCYVPWDITSAPYRDGPISSSVPADNTVHNRAGYAGVSNPER